MARQTTVLGLPAIIQSLEILGSEGGRSFTARPGGVVLEPGAMWSGDAILLSAAQGSVRYARGDALIYEDTTEFVARTYSPSSRRPPWMSGLVGNAWGFALKMAPALCLHWGPRGSVCAWLNAYGAFYSDNRPDIEVAGRQAGVLLEGLFALRARWSGVFHTLVGSMGASAPGRIERYVNAAYPERFLGFLLAFEGDEPITVGGLAPAIAGLRAFPTPEFQQCLESSMYARMVQRVEEAAPELTALVERLHARL